MTLSLKKLKKSVVSALKYNFTAREKEQVFFILLEHFTALSKITYLTNSGQEISIAQNESIHHGVMLLNDGIPIQHITEKAYFRDLELQVNKNVLLPRPETEELVSLVLGHISPNQRVLDLGSGSGCIGLSLKSELPSLEVHGIDISQNALDVAQLNAKNLGLEMNFTKLSMTENLSGLGEFQVLVSNPPYIGKHEAPNLESNVYRHEPHIALFSITEDPLYFYKALEKSALEILKPGGFIFLELHEDYANETAKLFKSEKFEDVEIFNDLQGKLRFLKAKRI